MITPKVQEVIDELFSIEDKQIQVIKLEEKLLNKEIGQLGVTHILERFDKNQVETFCISMMNRLNQEGIINF